MKNRFAIFALMILVLGLCAPPIFAQASGTVKGVCKDPTGAPIADGVVVWANQDNGQKYTLKTNKKGEYFSLGVGPGSYTVTLYKNADDAKANKELFHFGKVQVTLDENTVDFDLKKQAEDQAKGTGLSAEEVKKRQEQAAKAEKENNTIKVLNEKLNAAKTIMDGPSPDYETAIADLNEANQIDATRYQIWAYLGAAQRKSADKQTDPAERQKRLEASVAAYQKALELKQAATNEKDPNASKTLAGYYNNMADAYGRSRPPKLEEAMKAYDSAAQLDPTGAAQYYFNEGAILTNAGKTDDANTAFDKAIAADPNKAEAYYQKGVNLLGKATLQGDKTVAPPGTAEAFQKYLELSPSGPNAQSAKDLLASIGSSVETSFGKKKAAKK